MFNLDQIKEVFRGGMDDAETFLYAQFAALRNDVKDVRDAVDNLDTREEWFRRPIQGQASAAGTVDIVTQGPRPGFMWVITRLTLVVMGGAGSSAVVYSGPVNNPANAVQTIDDADNFAGDVVEIPVFTQQDLAIAVTGAPANARIAGTIWGKEYKASE